MYHLADWNHMLFIGVFWKISGKNLEKREYLLLNN